MSDTRSGALGEQFVLMAAVSVVTAQSEKVS